MMNERSVGTQFHAQNYSTVSSVVSFGILKPAPEFDATLNKDEKQQLNDKKANTGNKEIKMDVILMSKNKILEISKNKSLESKREETTSKSSISLEPIQRKDQDFQASDGLHMIDIIKGIEYYGKTTKFKNLR